MSDSKNIRMEYFDPVFNKAIKKADKLYAENKDIDNEFTKTFSCTHKETELKIKIIKSKVNGFRIYYTNLEVNDANIPTGEYLPIDINPPNQSYFSIKGKKYDYKPRVDKVIFNNVNFRSVSRRDSDLSIIDLCKVDSAEFNNCTSNIRLYFICGEEDLHHNLSISKKLTRVTINKCNIMKEIRIENYTNFINSVLSIKKSKCENVAISYKQLKEKGKCELEVEDNEINNLLIQVAKNRNDKYEDSQQFENGNDQSQSNQGATNIKYSIKAKLFALISDNIISTLKFSLPDIDIYEYETKLVNGNKIKLLKISDRYPNVIAWGFHEIIGKGLEGLKKLRLPDARKHIDNNKASLMKFKKMAEDKGDRVQEAAINSNIAKCDEQLIKLEPMQTFWQEKLIMWFGKISSNHGTSLWRPIVCALAFNLLIGAGIHATIYDSCSYFINNLCWVANTILYVWSYVDSSCNYFIDCSDYFYVVGELFNPVSTPISIVERINPSLDHSDLGNGYTSIVLLAIISKAAYAACIYEFIRSARRFTLK